MKANTGELVARALEDCGARFTFGIPGTHNIELYDALEDSTVKPILVTDEQCASFMADAVSRTTSGLGVANVVPGAGVTHALSGIAEAFMDNVPLLVLTCGIRQDTGRAFQLHDVDQLAVLRPITKAAWRAATAADVYPMVRRAADLARAGSPGPVAVEIPAELYLLGQELESAPAAPAATPPKKPDPALVDSAARMLNAAAFPILYVGRGAAGAAGLVRDLAERLQAPVATTIQGKGVFPESHPLWLWNGLGRSSPTFVGRESGRADVMLAVGCRFGEVATASYGFEPPARLIHVDASGEVFNRNFPAALAVEADARLFLEALLPRLEPRPSRAGLNEVLAAGHARVLEEWRSQPSQGRVTPARLFETLQRLAPGAVFTADSGNGLFLAMEHLRLDAPGRFIAPVDYSCMGYSVPAAVGAKLASPDRDVIALAGDGALLMTGLELITASHYKAGAVVCVLRDRELGQIAQFQRTTLDRATCTVLGAYDLEAFAKTVGAEYLSVPTDADLGALERAVALGRCGTPVMVDVAIDYSRKTYFTKGVVTTNFWRLPWSDRLRVLSRAAGRKAAGLFRPGGPPVP